MQRYNIFLILFLLFLVLETFGLEIDEKLPLRILKVSRTGKTILINRGLEDGLVNNDHAKFFLTKGVVARGVIIKTSPTRSVWSLYRVIDSDEIKSDRVMNLKISSPVKLTEDASKMLSQEDIPQYNRGKIKYYSDTSIPYYQGRVAPVYKGEPVPKPMVKGVPVAKGGMDIDAQELEALEQGASQKMSGSEASEMKMDYPVNSSKNYNNWEVFGSFSLNSLSSTTESSSGSSSSSGSLSVLDFNLGFSLYFPQAQGFWRDFSVGLNIHKATQSTTDITGISSEVDVLEYGGFIDWHLDDPFITHKMAWFLTSGLGVGNVVDSNSSTTSTSSTEGSASYFNIGGGVKYLANNSWGMRAVLDFYQRVESYSFDDETTTDRSLSGPRFVIGVVKRW